MALHYTWYRAGPAHMHHLEAVATEAGCLPGHHRPRAWQRWATGGRESCEATATKEMMQDMFHCVS